MKRNKMITAAMILVLIAGLIAGTVFMLTTNKKAEPVASFERMTLTLSTMRLREEYELICQGETTEVSLYYYNYADGTERRVLQEQAMCDTERVTALFNECGLTGWDGFRGKHPRHVKDGTMFTLEATVNGGTRIYADGSENFPKHFRLLTDGLIDILRENGT